MLFSSTPFLLIFLPITLFVYGGVRIFLPRISAFWVLVIASIIFYGYWSKRYLLMLLVLLTCNYILGQYMLGQAQARRKPWMILGVAANLLVLIYFKYTNFLIDNLNYLFSTSLVEHAQIILPLGISFFTFQKIAYLVDCYRGEASKTRLRDFALFVMFFPQLIAGPIVHHAFFFKYMNISLSEEARSGLRWTGFCLFCMGLFKKVILADSLGQYVPFVFDAYHPGLGSGVVWLGVWTYSLQLYFDFSGYSDMAIGLAGMFGLRLPLNFASPYQATSIIEFWRRWHMSLSQFLRDYLYIPLGGSRRGVFRRYCNLFITMVMGGLWHGASWNFILWGGLHASLLTMNHLIRGLPWSAYWQNIKMVRWIGWLATLTAVSIAWVPFRAKNIELTRALWSSMWHWQGDSAFFDSLPSVNLSSHSLLDILISVLQVKHDAWGIWVIVGTVLALGFKNSQRWLGYDPAMVKVGVPRLLMISLCTVLGLVALKSVLGNVPSTFLYFNF